MCLLSVSTSKCPKKQFRYILQQKNFRGAVAKSNTWQKQLSI